MTRIFYIFNRLINDLISLISRAINAMCFGGSTAQTLSARSYIDGRDSRFWHAMGRIINGLFFWEGNHIKAAWETEVDRARYVLRRLEGTY